MKKYDSYKNSGIEWIGVVPSHWDVDKLNRIFQINTGFTPSTGNNEFYENGKHDWITIRDLEGKYVSESKTKLTDIAVKGKTIIPKGSLLYSFKLSVGQMAFTTKEIYTNEAIFSVFPSKKLNLNYYYYLLDRILIHNSNENIYGAKILNQELIKASKLLVPSEEEQTTIANYLDHKTNQIDTLISKKQQFINLLQEERIAIINQAVTKGLDPNVPMKDSGIEWFGEIPEHWKLMRIGSLSQSITGYAFKSDNFSFENGIKIVRGDNVTENSLRWGDKTRYWNEYSDVLDRFQLEKNDIVIGMDGSKVGKNYAYVVEKDLPLLLVQRVARIRSHSELIAKWIHFNIGAYNFKYYINLSKTDPAIPHITLKNITSYPISIPDIDELNVIIEKLNSKLENLDETLKKANQEIELLKEYKMALISEIVTGKIDVRNEIIN